MKENLEIASLKQIFSTDMESNKGKKVRIVYVATQRTDLPLVIDKYITPPSKLISYDPQKMEAVIESNGEERPIENIESVFLII